jgi:hypothetical protein
MQGELSQVLTQSGSNKAALLNQAAKPLDAGSASNQLILAVEALLIAGAMCGG